MAMGTDQVSVGTSAVKLLDLQPGESVLVSNSGGTVPQTPGTTVVAIGVGSGVLITNGYLLYGSSQVIFSIPETWGKVTELWAIVQAGTSIVSYMQLTNR
jgi:hypothetical protein